MQTSSLAVTSSDANLYVSTDIAGAGHATSHQPYSGENPPEPPDNFFENVTDNTDEEEPFLPGSGLGDHAVVHHTDEQRAIDHQGV